MKKGISMVLLAAIVASGVFAQEEEAAAKKNTVFVDVGPMILGALLDGFGIGVGYERALNNQFSVLGHAAMLTQPLKVARSLSDYYEETALGIDIDVHGRWYPFKTALAKMFIGVGVGYGMLSDKVTPTSAGKAIGMREKDYVVQIGSISGRIGWKAILGPGLVIEPAASYTITSELSNNRPGDAPSLTFGGFAFNLGLGWAF